MNTPFRQLSPEARANKAAGKRDRHHSIRRFCAAYKLFMGCVDCGYNFHPSALDLDHVRGEKSFSIGPSQHSLLSIVAEMEKCEVRCANCHRIRTFSHPFFNRMN